MKFRTMFRLLLTLVCCTTLTWAAQEIAREGDGDVARSQANCLIPRPRSVMA